MRFNSTFRTLSATFIVLLCTLFAAPLSAKAQEKEAYVVQSIDETTLTFFYDDKIDTLRARYSPSKKPKRMRKAVMAIPCGLAL